MTFRWVRAWVLVALCVVGFGQRAGAQESPHLRLGNPSKAKADPEMKDNFLIVKDQFALSYNNSTGTPNWVSWRLRKADLGHAPRKPFHPDTTLPDTFLRVKPTDYRFPETGMTRGHMCPHSDRTKMDEDSAATFVMTNMVPQPLGLNAGAWNDLEVYCRNLVTEENKEVYIVAGPWGKGGHSSKGFFNTTNGKVVVPGKCWKVALVVDAGENDPIQRVNEHTRVLAAVMPNTEDPESRKWFRYRAKLTDVEELTGFKFFDKAPDSVMTNLRRLSAAEAAHLD
jgi:endonuclease G, mitochondrial